MEVHGWAFRSSAPGERVEVEQWVDGVLAGVTTADIFRGDLLTGGVGDGAHGWCFTLALDPGKSRPQHVEFRFKDGRVLSDGKFDVVAIASAAGQAEAPEGQAAEPAEPQGLVNGAWGTCDGRNGNTAWGWAWRPDFPEEHVVVEQWVDGVLKESLVADVQRADLADSGRGHGRYGWTMKLALDPEKAELQRIEFRIVGGGVLNNGTFAMVREAGAPGSAAETVGEAAVDGFVGWYDSIKGAALHGWAWNPARPDDTAEVELWVDGVRTQQVVADEFRPDLRANGVGHGRYGFRLPIKRDPDRMEPMRIEIRIKDGEPVADGVFELKNDLSLDDPANAHLRSFVMSVLTGARDKKPGNKLPMPKTAMLIFSGEPREAGPFWAREYDDYRTAARYFAPVLKSFGEVVELASLEDVVREHEARRAKGEACLLFAFGPPRTTPLDAPCPVVPVFAWSFPSIPTGMWDGDRRSDWRYVLRTTGRAIVFSDFARAAVKAVMGPEFPVVAIPVPTADRRPVMAAADARANREISIRGVVLDSREHVFDPADTTVPSPVWRGGGEGESEKNIIRVSGVVFTSMLDISDGRDNWQDMISAFAAAHRGNTDATLVVRLSEANADWWREMFTWLRGVPSFTCRIIVIRGELDAQDHEALIAATHWYVSVPKAAGLALPLQEFMSAGRPAVSIDHTAMADYVAPTNSVLVEADEEPWTWPDPAENEGWSWTQHPADLGITSRYRVSWISLNKALAEAYRISMSEPSRYAELASGAATTMRNVCGDRVVDERLTEFLDSGSPSARAALGPSGLLREPPA